MVTVISFYFTIANKPCNFQICIEKQSPRPSRFTSFFKVNETLLKDGQKNNAYVPYVDYNTDYAPPIVMQPPISSTLAEPTREILQSTRLHLNSLQQMQLPLADLASAVPNGGVVDPRFSAAYGNPYLRNPPALGTPPNTANPAATPAPPPYSRASSNGTIPQVARLPNSPTSQYIVPSLNVSSAIKRGTMATHV